MRHGTRPGYDKYGCRCAECTAAERAHRRKCMPGGQAKTEAGDPAVPHGTPGGYFNWGCRCDECRAAQYEARKVGA